MFISVKVQDKLMLRSTHVTMISLQNMGFKQLPTGCRQGFLVFGWITFCCRRNQVSWKLRTTINNYSLNNILSPDDNPGFKPSPPAILKTATGKIILKTQTCNMQLSAKNSSMHVIKIICQNKFGWERLQVDTTGKKKHYNIMKNSAYYKWLHCN